MSNFLISLTNNLGSLFRKGGYSIILQQYISMIFDHAKLSWLKAIEQYYHAEGFM